MSLDHAILGFLQYGSSSGYDLKSIFDLSVRNFWPADQSQIYRTLARLQEQELVTMDVVKQIDRPDRKVYAITAPGRVELHRWLTTPLSLHGGRSANLVQIFFAGQLSDAEILAIFRRAAAECRQGLAMLRDIPAEVERRELPSASPREQFCWMLTLECGIRMTEANLDWLESVIVRIEQGELPPFPL